jgi:hypothetical protein
MPDVEVRFEKPTQIFAAELPRDVLWRLNGPIDFPEPIHYELITGADDEITARLGDRGRALNVARLILNMGDHFLGDDYIKVIGR